MESGEKKYIYDFFYLMGLSLLLFLCLGESSLSPATSSSKNILVLSEKTKSLEPLPSFDGLLCPENKSLKHNHDHKNCKNPKDCSSC